MSTDKDQKRQRRSNKTLLEFVVGMGKPALARMWADFNRWDWPRDLPAQFKPRWWDGTVVDARETRNRKFGFMEVLMAHADARTTQDAVDAAWKQATARGESDV